MQTQNQPMTAGNMPGGGAAKSMKASKVEKVVKPVDPLYTTAKPAEKGTVDQAKVAALKAKSNRPKALVRKSAIKLTKEQAKVVKDLRKASKEKFAERSELVKKEVTYRKNALMRSAKRDQCKAKKIKLPERKLNNCEIMYSVGPQPKYNHISEKFRQFREFNKTKLKFTKCEESEISYLYKVGQPVVVSK